MRSPHAFEQTGRWFQRRKSRFDRLVGLNVLLRAIRASRRVLKRLASARPTLTELCEDLSLEHSRLCRLRRVVAFWVDNRTPRAHPAGGRPRLSPTSADPRDKPLGKPC
jgi:hypothetical protein